MGDITFIDIFLREAFNAVMIEIGTKHWTEFYELALNSSVPAEFIDAYYKKDTDSALSCKLLFKRSFKNEEERQYAISYALAIAEIKRFHKIREPFDMSLMKQELQMERVQEIELIIEEVVQNLGCTIEELKKFSDANRPSVSMQLSEILYELPEIRENIALIQKELEQTFAQVEKLELSAKLKVGTVVQMLKFSKRPSVTKPKLLLKWFMERLLGIKSSEKELKEIQRWIEEFFSEKQNRSNIILMKM